MALALYELARRNSAAHIATVRNRRGIKRAVTEEDIDAHMATLASMGHLEAALFAELQEDIRRRAQPKLELVSPETTK